MEDPYKTPPESDDEPEITPPVEEITREEPESKPDKIREWDVGKESLNREMTQEEWVNKNRKERNPDFAPPSVYNTQQSSSKHFKNKNKSNFNFNYNKNTDNGNSSNSNSEPQKNWDFAPPTTYEYYGSTNTKTKRFKRNENDLISAIDKGLAELRKNSS